MFGIARKFDRVRGGPRGMKLQRIVSMRPAELMIRAGQELAKRLERSGLRPLAVPGDHGAAQVHVTRRLQTRRTVRSDASFRRWSAGIEARFFDGVASARARAVLENRMPEERAQILAAA